MALTELIVTSLLATALATGGPGRTGLPNTPAPEPPPAAAAVSVPSASGPGVILHAGGATPQGVAGSNSLEALDRSYSLGYRTMELDFCWTQDGALACVHDWETYYAPGTGAAAPSLAEFESVRGSTYGYTSMTLDHLAQWLESHPDARIVTDIKEDGTAGAALIAQRYPQLQDRFIIQIYRMEEYAPVAELGYQDIILTVYQMTWNEKTDAQALALFAADHPLYALTFPEELVQLSGYVDRLAAAGVPLYVHTVNDAQTQTELLAAGIAGIYTDFGWAVQENCED